jgi:hypothetical protein
MKAKLPEGYTCRTCGTQHRFPAYVYANWRAIITHTCPCGSVNECLLGHVTEIKPGKVK